MMRKLRAVLQHLHFPRERYNIFSGTNSWAEWRLVLKRYLSSKASYEDENIIKQYEAEFARRTDTKYGISFGAGRMALYAILDALDIKPGDEVIMPAYTCVVVPNALIYRGVKPVYVDIEPNTFNIDVSKIEQAITPKTKALYAQHTLGFVCDIEKINAIAKQHGLKVIEDCAHSLGATYKDKKVGSLADVAYFSTDHSKMISTLLGGMAVTNDEAIAQRLYAIQRQAPFLPRKQARKILRTFLVEHILFARNMLWLGDLTYSVLYQFKFFFYFNDELKIKKPDAYPYPCRLSSVQAEIGLSQLQHLAENLAHRRNIAAWLEGKMNYYAANVDIEQQAWIRYSFLVNDQQEFERLFGSYFNLGIWFKTIFEGRLDNFAEVEYKLGSCPVAEQVAQHIVNIPTHQRIPLAIVKKIFMQNREWVLHNLKKLK